MVTVCDFPRLPGPLYIYHNAFMKKKTLNTSNHPFYPHKFTKSKTTLLHRFNLEIIVAMMQILPPKSDLQTPNQKSKAMQIRHTYQSISYLIRFKEEPPRPRDNQKKEILEQCKSICLKSLCHMIINSFFTSLDWRKLQQTLVKWKLTSITFILGIRQCSRRRSLFRH